MKEAGSRLSPYITYAHVLYEAGVDAQSIGLCLKDYRPDFLSASVLAEVEREVKRAKTIIDRKYPSENPRDTITIPYLQSIKPYGGVILTVGQTVVDEFNNLVSPDRGTLSISDLIHPNLNDKRNRASFVGAFSLSQAVIHSSSLGHNMLYVIYRILKGASFDEGIRLIDDPLLKMEDKIKEEGLLRWFVPKVLLPLREKTRKYFQ